MKHSVETISDTSKLVKVEIPVERVDSEFQKLYTEINQNAFIPGFRKGKVPKSILKLRMGDDIATQIGYELIQETLPEAMKSIEDHVLGHPDLNKWVVEEGKPFIYEATVSILPPIELKEYKGIEVPRGKIDISDTEIAQGLERIQAAQTTYEVVEGRSAEANDRIYGRVTLSIGDHAVPGWTNRQVEVEIGGNTFFPDSSMEQGMIGASVETDHNFVVNFSEDYTYYRDFAGKEVSVVIKANDIKAKQVPAINDDLAKDMGLENVDELKKMILEDLEKRKTKEIEEAFESAILTKIQSCNDIPAPDVMVESEADFLVDNFFNRQVKLDDDQKKKLSETMKPTAEKRVRERLILTRIAELEGIQSTEEDIDKAFVEMAEQEKTDPATIRQDWEKDNLIDNLKRQIARNKALEWLKNNVVPVDPPPSDTSNDIPEETDSQE